MKMLYILVIFHFIIVKHSENCVGFFSLFFFGISYNCIISSQIQQYTFDRSVSTKSPTAKTKTSTRMMTTTRKTSASNRAPILPPSTEKQKDGCLSAAHTVGTFFLALKHILHFNARCQKRGSATKHCNRKQKDHVLLRLRPHSQVFGFDLEVWSLCDFRSYS